MGHCSVVIKYADSGARQDLHPTSLLTPCFVTEDKLLNFSGP